MDRKAKALFDAQARVLKALAHPSRLFMVSELAGKDLCVCELARRIGADMSTTSRHLSILKTAGIVRSEKKGSEVHYSLKDRSVLRLLGCVERLLKSSAEEMVRLTQRGG